MKKKIEIVAEAGVNHNGNLHLAKKLAKAAKDCGADYVKFQYFQPEFLATKNLKKAKYQINNYKTKNKSQKKMLSNLSLNYKQLKEIENYCKKIKIKFLLSIFDHLNAKNLKQFKLDYIKIPSGEITNLPLINVVSKMNKKLIISTGMCNLKEVKQAINICKKNGLKKNNLILLHCTTDYPTKSKDVNLKALITMKKNFNCRIGYSDHTKGYDVAIMSISLGAEIIEKHFTLDKKMKGPDHKASLDLKELKKIIEKVKNAYTILGCEQKKANKSELKNIKLVRKSIRAKNFIKKGDKFSEYNIIPKRPADGLSPMLWNKVIGKIAKKNFKEDDKIEI